MIRANYLALAIAPLALVACPAPAAAQVETRVKGTIVQQASIYFVADSVSLESIARETVAALAPLAKQQPGSRIILIGHSDSAAADSQSLMISLIRVEVLRSELVRLGIPSASITSAAMGEAALASDTADGVREPLNRRVEIIITRP